MDKKIGVIVKGIIIYRNKVLLVKRSENDKINPGNWEFVGGRVEFDEGLEKALKREAMEEVGIVINIKRVIYATTYKRKINRQAFIIVYKCSANSEEITLSEEHSEYKWVSKEELKKLLYKDILKDLEKHNIFPLIYEEGNN